MPIFAAALAVLLASAPQERPPREESPVPRDVVSQMGTGNSDEVIEQQIAEARSHPLGTAENPIRVAGPEGAQNYMGRLRCSDGRVPKIGRSTDGGVGTYGSVLQSYPLDCGAAAPGKVNLLVDMYHEEHVETQPPAGFTIGR